MEEALLDSTSGEFLIVLERFRIVGKWKKERILRIFFEQFWFFVVNEWNDCIFLFFFMNGMCI